MRRAALLQTGERIIVVVCRSGQRGSSTGTGSKTAASILAVVLDLLARGKSARLAIGCLLVVFDLLAWGRERALGVGSLDNERGVNEGWVPPLRGASSFCVDTLLTYDPSCHRG